MQAKEAWAKYIEHTKTLSAVTRNLTLSGVVAVWACRSLGDQAGKLTPTLTFVLLMFGASVMLDVAHYWVQARLFYSKTRSAEREAEKDPANHDALSLGEIDVVFLDSDYRAARAVFTLKIVFAVLGWLVLMCFLAVRLVA